MKLALIAAFGLVLLMLDERIFVAAAALAIFLYAAKVAVTNGTKALVAVTAAVAVIALAVHLA